MKIGGLQPLTLSDFPGRVAAIVFTQGCNFRCPFCHNDTLLDERPPQRRLMPVRDVFDFLQGRVDRLDGVVISGGEPTIQPGLSTFLRRVKRLGFATKLDTNGSRPDVLQNLLDECLLDYIAMDVKAPWDAYERLAGIGVPIARIKQSMTIIANSGIEHEFRTTEVRGLLSPADLQAIRQQIPSGSPHRLQVFERRHALDPRL